MAEETRTESITLVEITDEMIEKKIKVRKFGSEEFEVTYSRSSMQGMGQAQPLQTGLTTVENGILIEHDVPVQMRDGVTLYVDVFRPEGATNLPSIIALAFSKSMAGIMEHGVPPGTASRWHKLEAADPFYWCHYGYAVINVDSRGCGNSEGDANWWGKQAGMDGYDIVEWTASREWSNGKVGAFGNSGVAMESLFTAAENPPHLVCIAPWEGTTDLYRGFFCQGGVPEVGFCGVLSRMPQGKRGQYGEDWLTTYRKYPLMNAYWEDKIVNLENIEIPIYACAGWSHFHLRGALESFRKSSSPKKWLRCHRDFEWPDDWTPRNIEDLHHFFDRYLKDIRNGWEMTPRVRIEVMDSGDCDYQTNRPEREWPLARTQYTKMFLDAGTSKLSFKEVKKEASVRYESTKGHVVFTHQFKEDTELTGYMKLRLWVEAEGTDDMDLFIFVQKGDEKGEYLPTLVLGEPHTGSVGIMRVSLRELDDEKSTPYQPVQAFRRRQFLKPKEIVPVDIEVLPTCKIWHAGEHLRVVVSGHYERKEGWFEPFRYDTINKGNHIIYTGGKYDSHLLVPIIPPKLKTGTYIRR